MKKSDLELELLSHIRAVGLPEPVREYMAIPGRKFRFDFAYPDKKLLIEVQGAIWKGGEGGHSSGVGLSRDYEKNNLAILNGWKVMYFTGNTIRGGEAVAQIEEAVKSKPRLITRDNGGKDE